MVEIITLIKQVNKNTELLIDVRNEIRELTNRLDTVSLTHHLPRGLPMEGTVELYRFLLNNAYISPNTNAEVFLYLMGATDNKPAKLKPINWLSTMQQLRVMLESAFKLQLKGGL